MENKIKTDDIKYVAELARIKLSEKEAGVLSAQLNDILEYINKLNKLDTTNTEPMSHALNMTNVFRKDEVMPSLTQQDALKNVPDGKDGFFRVPKVI
ncbi:MAG: Asp-tRNA(Asn)/Glu-tRNA(Gln) amidotransferase subunit GatC [Candidatus Omnitrophica bacterium]|nr:Asp-tRNA(Asn)/Glu-tRNA(Gln) amidotransferase subunit GatC [Candidatus Omnitrophota bacterium]